MKNILEIIYSIKHLNYGKLLLEWTLLNFILCGNLMMIWVTGLLAVKIFKVMFKDEPEKNTKGEV